MKIWRWTAIFAFLILPFLALSIPAIPVVAGRAIAVSCFMFLLPPAIVWYGLSPKLKMISPGGKLSEPRFDRARPRIEKGIRALFIAFALFFTYWDSIPFGLDLFRFITGEKPARVIGRASEKRVPWGGLWFLKQSVQLAGNQTTHYLFYSWESIQVGKSYEFLVLPESDIVLEFHRIS